eukprot:TRINITY_DN619_c0_g1_i3.p1 TRINITY_DN619_c0_g1~~TRINITY_DN619_c0_g1_i3.p1  ORF type:complete len:855 (-),score=202.32 TRINITY_DN619_c0_g1_i3:153-2717(-)
MAEEMGNTKVADPWNVEVQETDEKAWEERTPAEKAIFVSIQVGKVCCVIGVLYLFIVSLGLMGSAFKIIGGPTAGAVFRNQEIFDNPIAGLVLGVLATVLVQSSSTSTSIIISMTAAGLMEVKNAIPMIMGANIGTSVTNTIVSIGQIGNRDEYRRAFAGATVHDCFNMLTVTLLLPIEAITGFLRHLSAALCDAFGIEADQDKSSKIDFLKVITKPVTSRLVQVDKKLVTSVAKEKDAGELEKLMKKSMIVNSQSKSAHLFMDTSMSDEAAGWILLIASLVLLCTCLILLVITLQSVFRGRAAIWMKSLLNLEFKSVPCIADYILLLFGAGITILMQSSSITTSTLTPLVGIGLIRLEKMFPFTVGANIGTCITGILSALAGSSIYVGMQVALSHLLFNFMGTLIWFPLPFMRRVPIAMARFLGNMAADWRWFPIVYIIFMFGILPLLLFLLSLAGVAAVAVGGTFIIGGLAALITILALRLNRPQMLPSALLRDPAWLPMALRVDQESAALAEQQSGAVTSSADVNKSKWWQGPWVWGLGWFVIMFLICGVPNNQWGIVKYTKFDGRDHIGIGAWSSCSASFTDKVLFRSPKVECSTTQLNTCFNDLTSACAADGFSSQGGAYKKYEASWSACRDVCTTEQWDKKCTSMSCEGSLHAEQCGNITSAVKSIASVKVTYGSGAAWEEGDKCRANSEIFDDASAASLAHAGNLGIVGIITSCAGQISVLSYIFLDGKRDMRMALIGSLVCFAITWIFLVASWGVFSGALGNAATMKLIDDSETGAIIAEGNFGDIIDGASFSFHFVLISWLLTMPIMALIGQKLMAPPAPSSSAAPEATAAPAAPAAPATGEVDI